MTPAPARGSQTSGRQGLSRFEYARSRGWLARYYACGRLVQRLFSDGRYGDDPERSYTAAQAYLLRLLETEEPRPRFRTQRSARNRTGAIGVCLRRKRARNGTHVWLYSVNYTLEGRRRTKGFALHHYPSRAAAWRAARAFRQQMEAQMQAERVQALRRQWQPEAREATL